jgi:hypothetical protein
MPPSQRHWWRRAADEPEQQSPAFCTVLVLWRQQPLVPRPADWVHVDMFDGSMVANFTIGPPVLKSLRQHSGMFMDCHLAVNVGARGAPGPCALTGQPSTSVPGACGPCCCRCWLASSVAADCCSYQAAAQDGWSVTGPPSPPTHHAHHHHHRTPLPTPNMPTHPHPTPQPTSRRSRRSTSGTWPTRAATRRPSTSRWAVAAGMNARARAGGPSLLQRSHLSTTTTANRTRQVMPSLQAAIDLAAKIRELGMRAGVALAPDTGIGQVGRCAAAPLPLPCCCTGWRWHCGGGWGGGGRGFRGRRPGPGLVGAALALGLGLLGCCGAAGGSRCCSLGWPGAAFQARCPAGRARTAGRTAGGCCWGAAGQQQEGRSGGAGPRRPHPPRCRCASLWRAATWTWCCA